MCSSRKKKTVCLWVMQRHGVYSTFTTSYTKPWLNHHTCGLSVCNIVVALVALMVIYKIYCLFHSGVIQWLGFSVFGLFLFLLWCFAYKTINSTIIHYSFKEERVCSYIIRSIFFFLSMCVRVNLFFATNLHVVFCERLHVLAYRDSACTLHTSHQINSF